jgi:hypothetical protein
MRTTKPKILQIGLVSILLLIFPVSHAGNTDNKTTEFNKTLTKEGISFRIHCSPCNSSLNQLIIIPGGLEIDNGIITQEITGTVTNAEISDLNNDGSPEIYIYITSAGSGSYGELIAYSANNKKSLSMIYLPPLTDDKDNSKGYMGHDQFSIMGKHLVRKYPIYNIKDSNANPTGKTRKLYYTLVAGETGWKLEINRDIKHLQPIESAP